MRNMKRWKKWSVIIPIVMAAVMLVITPVSALAQSHEEAAPGQRPLAKGSLAIVAPRMAGVNQEISMTVFLRSNQEPFPGAGVWALTQDEAEALRAEIQALRGSENFTEAGADYEAIANARGRFLGRTNENGKLHHAFGEGGTYVLAAFHKGYFPGFSPIHVREMPKALAITAPKRASVGEEVLMTVTQRGTDEAMEGAGIWAVSHDNAEALRDELRALAQNEEIPKEDKDYAAVVSFYGDPLGRTDVNGQLVYAFTIEGGYALVTVMAGYHPGSTGIRIGDEPKALAIEAPKRAGIGEEVTMTVSQKGTDEAMEGAGIWAITRDNAELVREALTRLREDGESPSEHKDFEAVANTYGIFLGRTHAGGELSHAFTEGGGYMLMTVKANYFPGFTGIFIGDPPKALAIQAPRRAHVGQMVTMTVVERGEEPMPVEGATVWVIAIENAETLQQDFSALRQDSSIAAEDKNFESVAGMYGYPIGQTNEFGQLSTSFDVAGGYLLITIKAGYFPGMAPIHIVPVQTKADELRERGVPGQGIDNAPGLQVPPPESRNGGAPNRGQGNRPGVNFNRQIPNFNTTDA